MVNMEKPNISREVVYLLKDFIETPEAQKIKKEILDIKSKYPKKIYDMGMIDLSVYDKRGINEMQYSKDPKIQKGLRKTYKWFEKMRKELKRKAAKELRIKQGECEIECFIDFFYKPDLFLGYNKPETEAVKIIMKISLKPWFYKMLRIFDENIKLEKGENEYEEAIERISAEKAPYRQVEMWGGIDLPIST